MNIYQMPNTNSALGTPTDLQCSTQAQNMNIKLTAHANNAQQYTINEKK